MPKPSRPARRDTRCPTCGKPSHAEVRPFCSKRCRDVDLARWFEGAYAIPVVEDDEQVIDEPDRSR